MRPRRLKIRWLKGSEERPQDFRQWRVNIDITTTSKASTPNKFENFRKFFSVKIHDPQKKKKKEIDINYFLGRFLLAQ